MEIPKFSKGEVLTAEKLNTLAQAIADDVGASPALQARSTTLPGVYHEAVDAPLRVTGWPEIKYKDAAFPSCSAPETKSEKAAVYMFPDCTTQDCAICLLALDESSVGKKIYEAYTFTQKGKLLRKKYAVSDGDTPPGIPWDELYLNPYNIYGDEYDALTAYKLVGVIRRDLRYACSVDPTKSFYIEKKCHQSLPHWIESGQTSSFNENAWNLHPTPVLRYLSENMDAVMQLREHGGVCIRLAKPGTNPSGGKEVCSMIDISSGIELWPGGDQCLPPSRLASPCCKDLRRPGCSIETCQWRTVARLKPEGPCLNTRLFLESYQSKGAMWRTFLRLSGCLLQIEEINSTQWEPMDPGTWYDGEQSTISGYEGTWYLYPLSSLKDFISIPYEAVSGGSHCIPYTFWWAVTWIFISPTHPGKILYMRARAKRNGPSPTDFGEWENYTAGCSFMPQLLAP